MKTPPEPVTVDDMLKKAGDFNRYQLLLLILFSYVNILSAIHYFSQTFISIVPEHWCNATELSHVQVSEDTLPRIRNYLKGLRDPSCSKYMWNGSGVFAEDGLDIPMTGSDFEGVQEVTCKNGWVYYDENGYNSIVAEMDWVCEDAWKPVVGQSMYFVGSVFGTLSFGILSDRIGRLPIVLLSFSAALIGNTITYFSFDLPVFATGRLIAGVATDSVYFMMYIIVMEYVRPCARTFSLNITAGLFYGGASALVPFLAIWAGNWRDFLLVTTLPIFFVMTYYFIVPESALWLLSKGHVEKAVGCFKRIAALNGRSISEDDISTFVASQAAETGDDKVEGNLIALFKTPRLRQQMLILIFKSMVLTLCYDAISRNIDGLGVSPFLVFSAASLTLLPACFILMMVQDRVGRKATASLALLFTGIVVAASGVVAASDQGVYATASLILLARLGINTAYNSSTQYAAELVPTMVRGQGVAVMHVVGYAATFFSSYILFLNQFSPLIPALILGFLCILCAFFCLLLPETLGRVLPTTMEDGERFGEGDRMWDFYCCTRNPTVSTTNLVKKDDGDCI